MNILVNVHSFVDLITNSSTETFVSATSRTKEVIGEIITELSGRPWEELFEIGFVESTEPEDLAEEIAADDEDLSEEEVEAKLDELMSKDGWEKHGLYEWRRISSTPPDRSGDAYSDYPPTTEIMVSPKDPNNERAIKAAKLLQGLMGTYSLEARGNY